MSSLIDLTGREFGRLTVVERAGSLVGHRGRKKPAWLCRCDCGEELPVRGDDLRSGNTKSCGCLLHEMPGTLPAGANPNWKGDEVEYAGAHSRVRRLRGRASEHACIDCGDQARDWSYVGGCPRERISKSFSNRGHPYSPDPDKYVPRCKLCHNRLDHGYEVAA